MIFDFQKTEIKNSNRNQISELLPLEMRKLGTGN